MSLINEALKRAREEAARREAAEKGLPLASPGPVRDRGRWLTLAVVVLAGALLVSLVLLANLSSKLPSEAASTEAPAAPPQPARELANPNSGQSKEPTSTVPAVDFEAIDSEPSSTPPETGAPTEFVVEVPPTGPRTVPDVQPSARDSTEDRVTRTESPVERASSEQPREFVGQARLSGGQLVDLEGIAWSESEPFALLNGQVVGIGEFIRSYRVLEIHQDRVLLQDGEETVLLHLQ